MSALLESLLAGQDTPEARAILTHGLPAPRSESWKYTPLRALARRSFAPASAASPDPALIADIPAPRLVFVNGTLDTALSRLDALPAGLILGEFAKPGAPTESTPGNAWHSPADAVFRQLNTLLAQAGADIRAEGEIATALHLVRVETGHGAPHASHLRHRLHLAAASRLTVVEHQLGDADALATCTFDIRLEENAHLQHYRLARAGHALHQFAHTEAELAAGSHYQRLDLELGAALSRHELNVRLAGAGARLEAGGVLLADGRRHLDTRLGITHAAPDTQADLPWRALADGRARAVFHGGITIEAGADGSEADLQNRNLLLSGEAEIDTQPVLVIHADEVKAAHGASVGQLDANALFYLRARGIPENEARRILTAAFCHDLLARIDSPALRGMAEAHIDAALARVQA